MKKAILTLSILVAISLSLAGTATAAEGLENPAFDNTSDDHESFCDEGHYTHSEKGELRFCFQENVNGPAVLAVPGQEDNVHPGNADQ